MTRNQIIVVLVTAKGLYTIQFNWLMKIQVTNMFLIHSKIMKTCHIKLIIMK